MLPLILSAAGPNSNKKSGGLRVTPRNTDELNQAIELRKQSFQKERAGMNEMMSQIYEKQNKLRSGAQNLMIMENMMGVHGPEVSRLAEDLNSSSVNTLKLEEAFQNRGKVKKFFFGQNKEIVESFSTEISQRDESITRLRELFEDSEITPEVKDIFRVQLTGIEEEQNRIKEYFQKETKRKGILTWFLNIFK